MAITVVPKLARGSLPAYYMDRWESIFWARFQNMGTTTTIIPLIDPINGRINTTTFSTRVSAAGGSSQTATWSTAPTSLSQAFSMRPVGNVSTWTTDSGLRGPSGIPSIKFNGTANLITIPDAAYWSRGDGASDSAFSISAWCVPTGSATTRAILTKNNAGADEEWAFEFEASTGKLNLSITDESAAVTASRKQDTASTLAVPHHVGCTYDATGGATAANGIALYVDGVAVTSTATNNASYVAMENLTAAVAVMAYAGSSRWNDGVMFGGPLGPAFVQAALTAAQMKNEYLLGAAALGL